MYFTKRFSPLFYALLGLIVYPSVAQEASQSGSLQLILPEQLDWNILEEGQEITVELKAKGGKGDTLWFSMPKGRQRGMIFDSLGLFKWTPSHDIADRINTVKSVPVVFEVRNNAGETAYQQVVFKIIHVNRPPEVDELRPFYVQYKTVNTYQIDMNAVRDADNDPIVFIPMAEQMPEGMKISAAGEVTWEPSLKQFAFLKEGARYIEFYVEDQPSKARTKGRLRVEATTLDLEPEITIVPKDLSYRLNENNTVSIKFFLSDPNGDDDIAKFDFISENRDVPASALRKNTPTSYEFIWQPGYDFVKDPYDTLSFNIVFYVLDKSQNRKERKIRFTVKNTVNEALRDQYLYSLYRGALVNAWGLLEQMREREEYLKRQYRRAKKGKQHRSVVNASLGATTGLSSVIAGPDKPALKNSITAVGGTTVATIGTLEATEVIGKSTKDLLDRFNYVMEKKSELQNKGDIFAREYSLKSSRKGPDFIRKLDEFRALMNLKGLVALELDANWENKKEATDKAIKRSFKDFAPLDEEQQ